MLFRSHISIIPFVAALLGSINLPTIIHGLDEVAPKMGMTHYKILKAANKKTNKNINDVCKDLETTNIQWGYIDQSITFPKLYQLKKMRTEMVKRPLLATHEKLLQPIRCQNKNYLITGYTHTAYRETLSKLLQSQDQLHQSLIVRGSEGSAQLPIDRRCPYLLVNKEGIATDFIHPKTVHLSAAPPISPNYNISTEQILNEGQAALKNTPSTTQKAILYQALSIITLFNIMPYKIAYDKIMASLASGKAYHHWQKGMT